MFKQKNSREKEKNGKNKTVLTFLIVVIILIALLGTLSQCSTSEDKKGFFDLGLDKNAVEDVYEGMSQEEIIEELNKKVEQSMINTSMNKGPTFETQYSEGTLNITNSDVNNYSQVVEIYLRKEVLDENVVGRLVIGYAFVADCAKPWEDFI